MEKTPRATWRTENSSRKKSNSACASGVDEQNPEPRRGRRGRGAIIPWANLSAEAFTTWECAQLPLQTPASLREAGPSEQSAQGLRVSLLTHRASGQHHPDFSVFPAAPGL